MITDDEVAITLSNSPMDSAMTPGASDSFNSNDCGESIWVLLRNWEIIKILIT
jgi:hypothetical protein